MRAALAKHSIRADTKSGRAQNRGFHPSAEDALARWMDTRKALGIGNHGRRLFCTLGGTPLSDDYVLGLLRTWAPWLASASACTRTDCGTHSPANWRRMDTGHGDQQATRPLQGGLKPRYLDHLSNRASGHHPGER